MIVKNAYKLSMLYCQTWDSSKCKEFWYRELIVEFSQCEFNNINIRDIIKLKMWENPLYKEDVEIKMLRLIYCRKTTSLLVLLSSILRIGKRSAVKLIPKDLIRKLKCFI